MAGVEWSDGGGVCGIAGPGGGVVGIEGLPGGGG